MKNFFKFTLIFTGIYFLVTNLTSVSAQVNPTAAYETVVNGKGIFVDVRELDEVKTGMIKNALWIPVSRINQDIDGEITKLIDLSREKELFIYCRSGNRAGKVIKMLEDKGKNAINMGGFEALKAAGLPTQDGP